VGKYLDLIRSGEDEITRLMRAEGIDYVDALERLAVKKSIRQPLPQSAKIIKFRRVKSEGLK
jgi:polysaccharide pyruvyl transferase WcaK-like protein